MDVRKVGPSGGAHIFSAEPIDDLPTTVWKDNREKADFTAKNLKKSKIEQKENPDDLDKRVFETAVDTVFRPLNTPIE